MGGVLATKTFTKDKENLHVHFRIDNTAARSYINRMGGTGSQTMSQEACDQWHWCLQRDRQNTYWECSRQGVQNSEVNSRMDAESDHMQQSFADTGPMLSRPIRIQTQQPDGQVCQLASRPVCNSNRRLPVVMAGRNWVRISPIGKCLQKIRQEDCAVVLVTPTWDTQP